MTPGSSIKELYRRRPRARRHRPYWRSETVRCLKRFPTSQSSDKKSQIPLSFHLVILAQEMRQFDLLMGWSKRSSQRYESRHLWGQARAMS